MDLSGQQLRAPASRRLTVHCTCSNRDLPSRLPFGNESGDFEIEGVSVVKRIVALRKPSATLRPPAIGRGTAVALDLPFVLELPVVGGGRQGSAFRKFCAFTIFRSPLFLKGRSNGITSH